MKNNAQLQSDGYGEVSQNYGNSSYYVMYMHKSLRAGFICIRKGLFSPSFLSQKCSKDWGR
jgi:hypothetical protein